MHLVSDSRTETDLVTIERVGLPIGPGEPWIIDVHRVAFRTFHEYQVLTKNPFLASLCADALEKHELRRIQWAERIDRGLRSGFKNLVSVEPVDQDLPRGA